MIRLALAYLICFCLLQASTDLCAQSSSLYDILRTSDSLAALYEHAVPSQAGTKRVTAFSGGVLTVPEGKVWSIEEVTVSDGSGFNIKVSSLDIPDTLYAGEQIKIPVFGSESHLLDNPSEATYTFEINEKNDE